MEDVFSQTRGVGARVSTLSRPQEQLLFLRYNYARKRIAELLSEYAGRMLTAAATRRLLAWGYRALVARNEIVRSNTLLVLAMAKRTQLIYVVDFEEIVSEGNLALLRSVEKFDCSRGYKFSTYCCAAILRSFSRVAARSVRRGGMFPTELDPAMGRIDYIDYRNRERDVIEEACVDELKVIIRRNLASLSKIEKTVIRERFDLGGPRTDGPRWAKTLEQVGGTIGMSKERARQIQKAALKKLRSALDDRLSSPAYRGEDSSWAVQSAQAG
jgi:RNA polymerase sigma factor (sigma-70 family)